MLMELVLKKGLIKKMNKVSIIVPVYNVSNYVSKCVESIIAQTYSNIEILLVDDGSTDNSPKICDELGEKDSRIKVYHKQNGGLSDARNFGIAKSSGDYLFFVDSDDFIESETIEVMLNAIIDNKADISICNRFIIFDSGKKYIKFKQEKDCYKMNNIEAIFEMNNFEKFDMSATCKLFKKNLFENIMFPVGKISEDFFIMYKILDNANCVVSLSRPLYYYYQRDGSISKSKKLNKDFIEASLKQCLYVEKKYPNLKTYMRSSFVSANMTSYNIVYSAGGLLDKNDITELRRNVKDNYCYINNNKKISKIKKIQAFLFIKCLPLYNILYKIYKYKEKNV